jgi:hypothetical protein
LIVNQSIFDIGGLISVPLGFVFFFTIVVLFISQPCLFFIQLFGLKYSLVVEFYRYLLETPRMGRQDKSYLLCLQTLHLGLDLAKGEKLRLNMNVDTVCHIN